jgi:cytoskeletal protein RodZ
MRQLKFYSQSKSVLLLITAFSFTILLSCNQSGQKSETNQQAPVLPQNQEQAPVVNPEPEQPATDETTEQEQQSSTEKSGEVMLNPPHGEPYHRCDIPVGAPLNSPPANTAQQTISNAASTSAPQNANNAPSLANNPTAPTLENANRLNSGQTRSTTQTNNNTGTKPRLNPAHGQPWHRCDIPVGSPLP